MVTCVSKPLDVLAGIERASVGRGTGLLRLSVRDCGVGTAIVADRTDEILPLEMMYTLQNSGAALVTLLGTSEDLNLSQKEEREREKLGVGMEEGFCLTWIRVTVCPLVRRCSTAHLNA